MFPSRFSPVLFAILLSGMMSFIISGVSTLRAAGLVDGFFGLWVGAWLPSWAVAFPAVFILAPFTRKIVARLVSD